MTVEGLVNGNVRPWKCLFFLNYLNGLYLPLVKYDIFQFIFGLPGEHN